MAFTNLPEQGVVELYTVAGRLVRRQFFVHPGVRFSWDAGTIGNGVCICIVREPDGRVLASCKVVMVY
jgi:hypothetical protein